MIDFNNDNVLSALRRLSHTADGQTLIAHLKGELTELDHKNRSLDGNSVYRGQGAALALDDVIKAFNYAESRRSG